MANTEKVVPPRNDFKKEPVFVKATIQDQSGAKPGYRRQWFHKDDPKNPLYFGNYARKHRVGDPEIGYCVAEGWTVVQRDDAQGRKRDDDTKGVDTSQTHGDLVLMETTEENFRIYQKRDELRDAAMAKKLAKGDDEPLRGNDGQLHAQYKARLSTGDQFVDQDALLNGGSNG